MPDIFTTPLLTARDTARHLAMPESTLDYWLRESDGGEPLVHGIQPERRGWPRLPFVGIVEAHVLRSLRELEISKADIRLAVARVREEFRDPYALASRRLATDGVDLFVELADKSLVKARDNQRPIHEVIDRFLRYISWDDEGRPARLQLASYPESAHVVIDPAFGWGSPVVGAQQVPVESVVDLWRAGETMGVVAEEFALDVSVVEDVCRVAAA